MVKGQILEHAIKVPIASATISLLGDMPQSVVSDSNGHFVLKNVSVGRRSILISHIGFKSVTLNNLMVESGKELILNVEMDEDLSVNQEILIKLNRSKSKPINDLAMVSARMFSVEETRRFAARTQRSFQDCSQFCRGC